MEPKSKAAVAEDTVTTILYPTGLIGMELCLPHWSGNVFTRIDSVVGPYAYFRVEDNCSLELPDAQIVQEHGDVKLYRMPLDEVLRYESYVVGSIPIAHVRIFNGDVEKYTQLMRDLGYVIKGVVEKGMDAYFSTRNISSTRVCVISYGTDAALSYDCGGDWDLFYAISMIADPCAPAYMVDEQGIVFKNNPEHVIPSRFLSIQEIVAHLRNDRSQKEHSSKSIQCCCKCHRPAHAGEVYFVWDEIRACLSADTGDYVCPHCFEEIMGRPIQLSDLKRRYKADPKVPMNAVGQLILENIEFAYTKGWIHE